MNAKYDAMACNIAIGECQKMIMEVSFIIHNKMYQAITMILATRHVSRISPTKACLFIQTNKIIQMQNIFLQLLFQQIRSVPILRLQ
jgi:hypothetical protein